MCAAQSDSNPTAGRDQLPTREAASKFAAPDTVCGLTGKDDET